MTEIDLIVSAIQNSQTHSDFLGDRFIALTDSLDVATLFCDIDGRISFINLSGLKMLKTSASEFGQVQIADIFGSWSEEFLHDLKAKPFELISKPFDCKLFDLSGRITSISVLAHPLDISSNGAAHAMLILIPENKRQALHQALTGSGSSLDYLSNFLLLAQEAERKRIAADLHDGLGQVLTMIKLRVENSLMQLKSGKTEESSNILRDVVIELRNAVGEVRRISTQLRPSMLDDLGLIPTLQWFADQFDAAHAGIRVYLDIKAEEESIPVSIKTSVFRLIQEATNNIAKHSKASRTLIRLRSDQKGILVEIIDNGVGFEADLLLSRGACLLGIGINSMKERVMASKGTFVLKSYVGRGTMVSAAWGVNFDEFGKSRPTPLEEFPTFNSMRGPIDISLM
jgi:two-component system, NarL family, sensor kinase